MRAAAPAGSHAPSWTLGCPRPDYLITGGRAAVRNRGPRSLSPRDASQNQASSFVVASCTGGSNAARWHPAAPCGRAARASRGCRRRRSCPRASERPHLSRSSCLDLADGGRCLLGVVRARSDLEVSAGRRVAQTACRRSSSPGRRRGRRAPGAERLAQCGDVCDQSVEEAGPRDDDRDHLAVGDRHVLGRDVQAREVRESRAQPLGPVGVAGEHGRGEDEVSRALRTDPAGPRAARPRWDGETSSCRHCLYDPTCTGRVSSPRVSSTGFQVSGWSVRRSCGNRSRIRGMATVPSSRASDAPRQ